MNGRCGIALLALAMMGSQGASGEGTREYIHRLTAIKDPQPLLADFPHFVEPIRETARFEAAALIEDEQADLEVRAWRFSYNVRGIIEIPNRLQSKETAVVVVHPWGVDDGQGWRTPEPAGAAFQCTPAKNRIVLQHGKQVIDPLLQRLRPHVGMVLYSMRGDADPVRTSLYRSIDRTPTETERAAAKQQLTKILNDFPYRAQALPEKLLITNQSPVADYFRQIPGLDAGPAYDGAGFWDLPVPVMDTIRVHPQDVVYYDNDGYPKLRDFLKSHGIRHVLLAGYNTDMCVCSTTAGYENLRKDFNVFLVGDATIATFPANPDPRLATNATVSFASLNLFITQCSWIKWSDDRTPAETDAQ